MDRATNAERSAARALVGALEAVLAELAAATVDGDVDWLRPLALLSAEIEYSALRGRTLDAANLANECREVTELLTSSTVVDGGFASRYRTACRTSSAIAALHDRALTACRAIG